jgi:hypothetical protein
MGFIWQTIEFSMVAHSAALINMFAKAYQGFGCGGSDLVPAAKIIMDLYVNIPPQPP